MKRGPRLECEIAQESHWGRSTATRVAIVHDWLATYAGAERVLEQLLVVYPQADVFSVCDFVPSEDRSFLCGKSPKTTVIQKLPGARKYFRRYLPFMPLAIEQLDLSEYDVVLSSSHAVAKGVLTGPYQVHISYTHSPMRYAWDLQNQYLKETGLQRGLRSWLVRWMLHKLRLWDLRAASGVDEFIANSQFIARRIRKVYRRDSTVIYPPVDVDSFTLTKEKHAFYLAASRLVPYKRVDLIVDAFRNLPEQQLIVIGTGPEIAKIKKKAAPNVQILGYQSAKTLRWYMEKARAFLFAAEEDFGIMPVEAQACGTPVIALGRGGAVETIVDWHTSSRPTGILFAEQDAESIIQAVACFEANRDAFIPSVCRANAMRFSQKRFRREIFEFVEKNLPVNLAN